MNKPTAAALALTCSPYGLAGLSRAAEIPPIRGNDGQSLTIEGYLQFRYMATYRDHADPNEWTTGFQYFKTRVGVKGKLTDNVGFKIQGDANPSAGNFRLRDAYITLDLNDQWTFTAGQRKSPFLRETLLPDTTQLTAGRSNLESTFGLDRSQGLMLQQQAASTRLAFMLSDGTASLNTLYNAAAQADIALTGRADFLLKGDWKPTDQFTSFRGTDPWTLIGVSGHWQHGGDTNGSADLDIASATIDFSTGGDGWNLFAMGVWANTDLPGAPGNDDFGALLQGGVFLDELNEVFARYDVVIPDHGRTSNDAFNTVTLGVNHYFVPRSHVIRFTADVMICPDATASSIVSQNVSEGLLTSTDAQYTFRMQIQMVF